MISIKNENQIALLREAGKINSSLLDELKKYLVPGVSGLDIEIKAKQLLEQFQVKSSFLNYKPKKTLPPFPSVICISPNNVVVHGIPHKKMILKEGDIVSLDIGVKHQGVFTDSARTFPVGKISSEKQALLKITHEALLAGIDKAQPGNTLGDIGYAIASANTKGYGNVYEFSGHGVGLAVHEDPYVPNYGTPGEGLTLKPGMVLALEPMFTTGKPEVKILDDNYTVVTQDGSFSAHFEHTILITQKKAEILTHS